MSGRGRSGMHGGDRVHPGRSSVLFVVAPEAVLPATVELLRQVRERENVTGTTKMFSLPASELA